MDLKNIDRETLEKILKKVVAEELSKKVSTFEKYIDKSGVGVIKTSTVKPEPFDTGKPGDKVFLTDVLSLDESERLGCGIMEMEETAFDWTLNYDEIEYVIDGTLEIVVDGKTVTGNRGDILFIPKGSKIQFSAPNFARFMYVVYPANWNEQA